MLLWDSKNSLLGNASKTLPLRIPTDPVGFLADEFFGSQWLLTTYGIGLCLLRLSSTMTPPEVAGTTMSGTPAEGN